MDKPTRFVGDDDQKNIDELVAAGIQVDKELIAQLRAENERLERNRDMWKGQVERQAEELALLRKELRVMDVLAEAMAEVKAASDGLSTQPIVDIVSGCLAEIAAMSKESSHDR